MKKLQKFTKTSEDGVEGSWLLTRQQVGFKFYSTSVEITEYGTSIAYLPCSKYNLSQIDEREVTKDLRNRCCVLHLKGNRKSWIERLKASLQSSGFH